MSDSFARFDAGARRVLQRARDEAERSGLSYLGTEHLLLALLGQPRTMAYRALRNFGLDLESARAGMERLRATSPEHLSATPTEAQSLTEDAKRAIELGVSSSRGAPRAEISPAHLLLGLSVLESGLAMEYLRQRGINLQALRARTVQLSNGPVVRVPRRMRDAVFEPTLGMSRNNVVMCRLDDGALEAIDTLIEAGVRANRSDAAAWLIGLGLQSRSAVLDAVKDKVAEIRRMREDARAVAEDAEAQA